jgi:hypothetical protein
VGDLNDVAEGLVSMHLRDILAFFAGVIETVLIVCAVLGVGGAAVALTTGPSLVVVLLIWGKAVSIDRRQDRAQLDAARADFTQQVRALAVADQEAIERFKSEWVVKRAEKLNCATRMVATHGWLLVNKSEIRVRCEVFTASPLGVTIVAPLGDIHGVTQPIRLLTKINNVDVVLGEEKGRTSIVIPADNKPETIEFVAQLRQRDDLGYSNEARLVATCNFLLPLAGGYDLSCYGPVEIGSR